MKNMILKSAAMLALMFGLFLTACKKDFGSFSAVDPSEHEYQKEVEFLVNEMGFDRKTIEVSDRKIVVQGDMAFDGPNFWTHFVKAADTANGANDRKLRWIGQRVSTIYAPRIITINILPSAAGQTSLIQAAANVLNARNAKIRFACQSASTEADLGEAINFKVVSLGPNSSNTLAIAEWPSNGNPGYQVRINSGLNQAYFNSNTSTRLNCIVHEIGHCIGLCHTDTNDGVAISNVTTACKNNLDPNSFMHQYAHPWYTFTDCDKQAIKAIYNELPVTNSFVSMQSANYPTNFIRHANYLGIIGPVVTNLDKLDATFKIVPALAGGADCVSFESKNYPGYYLRHYNFRLRINQSNGTQSFNEDATFRLRDGLSSGDTNFSFESKNYPGRYIRHRFGELWLDPFGYTELFCQDASFKFTPPKAN